VGFAHPFAHKLFEKSLTKTLILKTSFLDKLQIYKNGNAQSVFPNQDYLQLNQNVKVFVKLFSKSL